MRKLLDIRKIQTVVLDWVNEMNAKWEMPSGKYYIETEDTARLLDLLDKAWWEELESYKGKK